MGAQADVLKANITELESSLAIAKRAAAQRKNAYREQREQKLDAAAADRAMQDDQAYKQMKQKQEATANAITIAGATSALSGLSVLAYSISSFCAGGAADPTAFWILGIGAGLFLLGLVGLVFSRATCDKQNMGIAAVLLVQVSAISLITLGGFEQALGNAQHHVFPGLGDVNTFLLIGVGALLLSLIGIVVYCKQQPKGQW